MSNQRKFYDMSNLNLKERKKLISLFKKHSHTIKIDDLDCAISFARVQSSLSYKEAIVNLESDTSMSLVLNKEADMFLGSEKINSELVLRMKNKKNIDSYSEVFIWFFAEKDIFISEILPKTKLI